MTHEKFKAGLAKLIARALREGDCCVCVSIDLRRAAVALANMADPEDIKAHIQTSDEPAEPESDVQLGRPVH